MKFKIYKPSLEIVSGLFPVLLYVFLVMGCAEKETQKEIKPVSINRDSICAVSLKKAEENYNKGEFNLDIPLPHEYLKPYVEEFFMSDCGMEISLQSHLVGFCGNSSGEEIESYYFGDSCYRAMLNKKLTKQFGNDIIKRVLREADSLYEKNPIRYGVWPDQITDKPQFIGGYDAMEKFLKEKIKYPSAAKRDSVQGKVFISIEVDSAGKITQTRVLKGIRKDLDNAALSAVNEFPDFIPAFSRGHHVASRFIVPINFTLK
jgi:TonB family protein